MTERRSREGGRANKLAEWPAYRPPSVRLGECNSGAKLAEPERMAEGHELRQAERLYKLMSEPVEAWPKAIRPPQVNAQGKMVKNEPF